MDNKAPLPSEPFPQTETDLLMEGLLAGVQSEIEISSDSGSVLEIPNGDPYCPVTGSQKDGMLDTTPIPGTALIINRGTKLPDALNESSLLYEKRGVG